MTCRLRAGCVHRTAWSRASALIFTPRAGACAITCRPVRPVAPSSAIVVMRALDPAQVRPARIGGRPRGRPRQPVPPTKEQREHRDMVRDAFKDADRIERDMGATTGSSWKTPPALSPWGPIRHAAAPERRDPLVEEASRWR
jgi:hypothetical protein